MTVGVGAADCTSGSSGPAPKVLLVSNWDWVLYNFRLALAEELVRHGYDVALVCPRGEYTEAFRERGLRWIEWSLSRRSLNPVAELDATRRLASIYRIELPDLVHHDTIKPNVYGALSVRRNRRRLGADRSPRVLNTFMGLGFLFAGSPRAFLPRTVALPIMRRAFSGGVETVFSNAADRRRLIELGVVDESRSRVMVSEHVDTERFSPGGAEPVDSARAVGRPDPPTVLFAGRMLWDKGLAELMEAADILRERGVEARIALAGSPDPGNPACVPVETLRAADHEGRVDWLGHQSDMPALLRSADIAVLPSYHEGLPRFLIEAAAVGLPLVATDLEACRRVIRDGENGILVPVRDAVALADALERLVREPETRRRMGEAGRRIAAREFDTRTTIQDWLELYEQLLTG